MITKEWGYISCRAKRLPHTVMKLPCDGLIKSKFHYRISSGRRYIPIITNRSFLLLPANDLWDSLVSCDYSFLADDRNIRNRKYGAPIKVINRPDGISIGASIVRPMASANTRSSAPSKLDNTMDCRVLCPIRLRII